MILDRENHVAAALAIAGTGNLLATDVIDLGVARDLGVGGDLNFYHSLNTAAPAGGTSIEFQIVASSTSDFSSDVVVLATTGAIAIANLSNNYLTFQPLPRVPGGGAPRRYLTTRLVRVGTFTGATTWSSGITFDVTDFTRFYNANYTA